MFTEGHECVHTSSRCSSSHRWPVVFHLIIWGSEAVRWMYSIFVGCWYPGPAIPLIRPQSLWVHKATSGVTNREVINPEARPQNWGNGVGLCVWGRCRLVKAPQHQNTGNVRRGESVWPEKDKSLPAEAPAWWDPEAMNDWDYLACHSLSVM